MNTPPVRDTWEQGNPYEQYIGRWSRRAAPLFLSWLNVPAGKTWVDVGCGTGALSAAILDRCSPASLVGVEPSEGFLKLAAQNLGSRARLLPGSAGKMPLPDRACDVVVSGLVLNFIPDLPAALAQMIRVASPVGTERRRATNRPGAGVQHNALTRLRKSHLQSRFLEVGKLRRDIERRRVDAGKPRALECGSEGRGVTHREAGRFVQGRRSGIEADSGIPEVPDHLHLLLVVPHVGSDGLLATVLRRTRPCTCVCRLLVRHATRRAG